MKILIKIVWYIRRIFSTLSVLLIFFHCSMASDIEQDKKELLRLLSNLAQSTDVSSSTFEDKDLKEVYQKFFKKENPDSQEKKDEFIVWNRNSSGKGFIKETCNFSEKDKNNTATNKNYKKFYGKIETYFDGVPPLSGTSIALDQDFVLTLASCVTFGDKIPSDAAFFAYNEETRRYTHRLDITAIIFSSQFDEFSEEGEKHNFSLLKLKDPHPLLKDLSFSFYSGNFPKESPSYILHGFKEYYGDLKDFKVANINQGKNFIEYKTDAGLGSAGAPLLIQEKDEIYIAGLHDGKVGALYLNNDIQKKINSIRTVSKERWGNKISLEGIKDIDSKELMKLEDHLTYKTNFFDNMYLILYYSDYKKGLKLREVNKILKEFIDDNSLQIWPFLKIYKEIDGSNTLLVPDSLQVLLINNIVLPSEKIQEISNLIQNCSKLESLHLRAMELGETEIIELASGLRRNPNVTFLDLAYNKLGDEGVKALSLLIKPSKNLVNLDLSHNSIRYQGIQSLAEYLKEKNIVSLNLAYNSLKDGGLSSILEVVKSKKSFKKLNLTHCDLTYHASDTIAKFLEESQAIRSLILSDNSFDHNIIQRVASALRKNTTLTELDLKNNKIVSVSSDLSYTLQNLWENTTLCILNLACNELKNEDAESLARLLRKNKGLINLDLSNNRISDEGAEFFALGLRYNMTLTKLDLSHNNITSNGQKEFTRIFKKKYNSTLSSLQLNGNPLKDVDSKNASYDLGLMYQEKGEIEKAKKFYIQAAKEKYPPAQHKMGEIFYQKYFEKRNEAHQKKYFKYYIQAAEAGYIPSQVELGNMYYLKKDYKNAEYWYQEAAKRGSDAARTNLKKMNQNQ